MTAAKTKPSAFQTQYAFVVIIKSATAISAIAATVLDLFVPSAEASMAGLEIFSALGSVCVNLLDWTQRYVLTVPLRYPDGHIGRQRLPFFYNIVFRLPAAGFAILAALPKLQVWMRLEPNRFELQIASILIVCVVGIIG